MDPTPSTMNPVDEILERHFPEDSFREKPDESVTLTPDRIRQLMWEAFRAGKNSCPEPRSAKQKQPRIDRELLFDQLMKSLPDYVYFKDRESRIMCSNAAHAEHLGADSPEECVGRTDFDYFEPAYAAKKMRDEAEIIRTGIGWEQREEEHYQAGRTEMTWVVSTKKPLLDREGNIVGIFGISREITGRKRAELALQRQHKLLRAIIDILPFRIYVRDTHKRFQLINETYRQHLHLRSAEEAVGKKLDDFFDAEAAARLEAEDDRVLLSGQPIVSDIQFDQSPVQPNRWFIKSKVPLFDSGQEPTAIVGISVDITEQKEAEQRAIQAFAEVSRQKEAVDSELAVARQLQRTLVSLSFERGTRMNFQTRQMRVRFSFRYEPTEFLAGDFFQVVPIDQSRFGILICDVMGHGVKAALITALIRGFVPQITDAAPYPDVFMRELNRFISGFLDQPDFPRFVTATFAVFDLPARELKYANAGHCRLLHLQADPETGGSTPRMSEEQEEPALGLIPGFNYSTRTNPLSGDDFVLLLTDGILEQRNPGQQEFGYTGILDAIGMDVRIDPDDRLERIMSASRIHGSNTDFADDICLVGVSISPRREPDRSG